MILVVLSWTPQVCTTNAQNPYSKKQPQKPISLHSFRWDLSITAGGSGFAALTFHGAGAAGYRHWGIEIEDFVNAQNPGPPSVYIHTYVHVRIYICKYITYVINSTDSLGLNVYTHRTYFGLSGAPGKYYTRFKPFGTQWEFPQIRGPQYRPRILGLSLQGHPHKEPPICRNGHL